MRISNNNSEQESEQDKMQLLRVKEVAGKCGVSVATVWNWCNPENRQHNPQFPRPFKVSERVTVWNESSIDEFIQAKREAARD